MESPEVTQPSTAGSSSVEDADLNQNKAGGSEVLLESDPPNDVQTTVASDPLSDVQTTVAARRRTLERGQTVDPLAEEEEANESVADKASSTKLETDLSGRDKEDIKAAKTSPSQSKEEISKSANNFGEQTVVDLEEVNVGNSSDRTDMADGGREDTVINGESSEVEDLVQMGGKLKSERQNEKSEPSEYVKNKKRLKKQLSVRFADDEDGPRSPISVTASAKSETDSSIEKKEALGRTRTVRDHIRDGLLRMLHPDSYEVDAFPLDQGVQSYQTFDWDSATRYRNRASSVGESVSNSDCVTSPVRQIRRMDSVMSALSEDEVDLYRRRGDPCLNRMESVMTNATLDSEVLSEFSKKRFNMPTQMAEGTTDKGYKMVYEKRKPFADKDRVPFVENNDIIVQITDIGRVSGRSERTLNPNLYFMEIHHRNCIWTVRRRYHHFLKLHEEMLIYKATLNIPFGDQNHRERSRAYREKSQRRLPHFPRTPDALVRSKNMAKRMAHLQKYLQAVLDNQVLQNHPSVLEFFEVSELSFIDELGLKAKEGWVLKKSGGHHLSGICSCCPSCKIKARYSKRWLITKDSFLAYMRPNDGETKGVMLFDKSFGAQCGKEDTGRSKCLVISNQNRALRVRCTSKLAAREWMVEILKAAKGSEYCQTHQHGSFAPVRMQNYAHWFADGELYFQSIADTMEAAQEEIFITDWWFNPDIYLKRPAVEGHKWKVDELLKRKAKQGVKIFILLYKEVELALGLDSKRTKCKLQRLHPNIKVMRHPDHPPGGIILWAHHEKLVVVDQAVAFVGGLDICYGRWDDFKHRLTDLGSVAHSDKTLEKNKNMMTSTSLGYDNQCTSEGNSQPTMPKQTSLPNKLLTHQLEIIVDEEEEEEEEEEAGKKIPAQERDDNDSGKGTETDDIVGQVASVSSSCSSDLEATDGTHQSKEQTNIEEEEEDWVIPVTVVETKLAMLGVKGKARLWPGKDYCNFVARDVIQPHLAFQDSVDRSTTPRMPWHDISSVVYGNAARDVARHFIERWNSTKGQKTKKRQSFPYLVPKSNKFHSPLTFEKVEGSTKCTCQVLRSVDNWSAGVKDKEDSIHQAYLTVIDEAKHYIYIEVLRSVDNWSAGVKDKEDSIHQAYLTVIEEAKHYIYIENQFFISIADSSEVTNGIADALYKRIVRAHRNNETFRVYVLQPLLPSFEGEVGSNSGNSIHAILHWEYRSMCRGKGSLLERLKDGGVSKPQQYIVFNGLRNWGELDGKLVSELVYIHSKLLIADDNTVIIGSANINDRSLLGSRDSEMAVLIKDSETVDSVMDGKMYQAGVYALGLRQRLFKEHLGILEGHWKQDVSDPVSEYFFKGIWMLTATNNTSNFEKVFRCAPTNSTRTFQQLKEYREVPTLASTNKKKALRILKNIRGLLVYIPLKFLSEESLEPSITTQEGIAPTKLWT